MGELPIAAALAWVRLRVRDEKVGSPAGPLLVLACGVGAFCYCLLPLISAF